MKTNRNLLTIQLFISVSIDPPDFSVLINTELRTPMDE
jgi:flavin reductase (DIM6/NTAB) family NADH-FMN oxidoreductase RutF